MFKFRLLALIFVALTLTNGCGDNYMKANIDAVNSLATNVSNIDLGDDHINFKAASESSVVPLYYNRHLTFNLLRNLFGPSINGALVDSIGWSSEEFGSSFGLYQTINLSTADCNSKKNTFYRCRRSTIDMSSPPVIGVSSPREALRMSACQRGVDSDAALAFIMKKIDKDATLASPPKAELKNYQRLYQLFFRGRPLPKEAFFDGFELLVTGEEDKQLAWEKLILSVCLSPHWQVM